MLLLQHHALGKFHVIDGQNTHDQIMSDRRFKQKWSNRIQYNSIQILVEVGQMKAGYICATHA